MTTLNESLLDSTAQTTAVSILNLLQHPISEEERLALNDAIYTVVRAGLHVAFELYRLRLLHPSSN